MSEAFVIAFTGARPSSIGSYEWNDKKNKAIRKSIKNTLMKFFENNDYDKYLFKVGMALGIDQYAMSVLIELRAEFKDAIDIKIEACVPFELQYIKWSPEQKNRYKDLLRQADIITYVDELDEFQIDDVDIGQYHKDKLLNRNKYMVNGCNLLLAYPIEGKKTGGTIHAINYALKHNKKVYITELAKSKKDK